MVIAFSEGPLVDTDTAPVVAVHSIQRSADPSWFDAWRSGSIGAVAKTDLGGYEVALSRADHAHIVMAAPAAPNDLGYLQDVWKCARTLTPRGASVFLDVHALTWHIGETLAGATDVLDVSREVRVAFDADTRRTDGAFPLHTRGMLKFGAPDLVALCGPNDASMVGEVVTHLAAMVARGTELALPRHALAVDDNMVWFVVDDVRGIGAMLQLNNTARILVNERGMHLVGEGVKLQALKTSQS
jgi:hypothetical protein